ncbi:helix-turn-helix domain-containing protein [Candidatus Saccharibacteria bacterium]|nr:MAG: helix-turn-helix domain-containing protein [Candidatus Saccharibacteria bacterium]QQS20320.1 MAG: helix-turn-helix domain-containing protein [Candidatus Saccharibacteria bacterium]
MTEKQLLVYGARIRLGWFRKAEELGNVAAACRFYGIPRRTYYYWHSRWVSQGKALTSLYDMPRTPKSHTNDADDEVVSLVVQLRLGLGYGENALAHVLRRDYGVATSVHGVHNILSRAKLLEERKRRYAKPASSVTVSITRAKSDRWMSNIGSAKATSMTSSTVLRG